MEKFKIEVNNRHLNALKILPKETGERGMATAESTQAFISFLFFQFISGSVENAGRCVNTLPRGHVIHRWKPKTPFPATSDKSG